MEAYIRRAIKYMGFTVRDDASLQGIVPYYSGVKATQSFENLLLELERNVHNPNPEEEKWITTDFEAALMTEAGPAAAIEAES
mmetsp:Transcript_154052/g.268465  ORF Transcript_154052/g.268465 Transcript_154052/m.268465 type:complete len:83 (+) Transcript_154052:1-249(+)